MSYEKRKAIRSLQIIAAPQTFRNAKFAARVHRMHID
jgi:hypothetical protein